MKAELVHPTFVGSKKKARADRRVEAVKTRLRRIYAYCRLLKTENELDAYLATIPDEAVRAATKSICEPFCLFRFRTPVTIATETDVMDAVMAADPHSTPRLVLP